MGQARSKAQGTRPEGSVRRHHPPTSSTLLWMSSSVTRLMCPFSTAR